MGIPKTSSLLSHVLTATCGTGLLFLKSLFLGSINPPIFSSLNKLCYDRLPTVPHACWISFMNKKIFLLLLHHWGARGNWQLCEQGSMSLLSSVSSEWGTLPRGRAFAWRKWGPGFHPQHLKWKEGLQKGSLFGMLSHLQTPSKSVISLSAITFPTENVSRSEKNKTHFKIDIGQYFRYSHLAIKLIGLVPTVFGQIYLVYHFPKSCQVNILAMASASLPGNLIRMSKQWAGTQCENTDIVLTGGWWRLSKTTHTPTAALSAQDPPNNKTWHPVSKDSYPVLSVLPKPLLLLSIPKCIPGYVHKTGQCSLSKSLLGFGGADTSFQQGSLGFGLRLSCQTNHGW